VLRPLAQPLLTQQLHTHQDYGPATLTVTTARRLSLSDANEAAEAGAFLRFVAPEVSHEVEVSAGVER
jgi:hypothetical protein